MKSDSTRFSRLPDPEAKPVSILWDGRPVAANEGDTLAAALLAAGISITRQTPKTGAGRGPFCMMGTCFDCLVVVEGRGVVQACQTRVTEGLSARPHSGLTEAADE